MCSDLDLGAFFRHDGTNLIIVVIHVDDFTIVADLPDQISEFKTRLSKYVEISDLGHIHWLLGIEVKRDRELGTISLSQHAYINSILRRYNLDQIKPVSSPMQTFKYVPA